MAYNAPFILSPFSFLNLIFLTSILVISVSHSWYCLALVLTVSTPRLHFILLLTSLLGRRYELEHFHFHFYFNPIIDIYFMLFSDTFIV